MVKAPVSNVPVVPVPPPEKIHDVLLVDDQSMVVLVLYGIKIAPAERDMVGEALPPVTTVVLPDDWVHAMSAKPNKNIIDNPLIMLKLNNFMIAPSILL